MQPTGYPDADPDLVAELKRLRDENTRLRKKLIVAGMKQRWSEREKR